MRAHLQLLSFVLPFLATACSAPAPAHTPVQPSAAQQPTIVVPETVINKTGPEELEHRFQQASVLLLREEFDAAAAEFETLAKIDPAADTAGPSLYNAGMAYAGKGDLKKAAERFRASAKLNPQAPTAKIAWVRVSRMSAYLEQWDELELVAEELLRRNDLSVLERIEA